jgi:hypothetical protein
MEDEGQALTTDSFASMLGGDGDNGQPETDPQSTDPDPDATAPDPDPDAADPDVDPDAPVDPDADPDGQPEADPPEAFLELEINGEKVKVSKDEAKNGYLRQQDYTQKAQKLAVERQEWSQHVAKQAAEVTQYSRELGALHTMDATLGEYEKVDWAALRNEDPMTYSVHMTDFNAMKAQRADMVAAIGHKQQSLQAAQKQSFAQASQEAAEHMAKVVPGFGKEHVAELREYGLKTGFSAEELANVADKRSLEVLWKAAQYDKAQATKQTAIKAVSALPTKANKPAPASKPAAQLNAEKQVKRVQQTGNVKDFAALLAMTS